MISNIKSVFEGSSEPEERPALPDITLEMDSLMAVLKSKRRRDIINVVRQCGQLSVSDVSEILAAREHDKPVSQITTNERKRLYVSVYQTHAPKLETHGLVEYDNDGGYIAPTDLTETADEIAGALDDATVNDGEQA